MDCRQVVTSCIEKLGQKFQKKPYRYLHEADLQAELQRMLLQKFTSKIDLVLESLDTVVPKGGRQVYSEMYVDLRGHSGGQGRTRLAADLVVLDDTRPVTLLSRGKRHSCVDPDLLRAVIELKLGTRPALARKGKSSATEISRIKKNHLLEGMLKDVRKLSLMPKSHRKTCGRFVVGFHRLDERSDRILSALPRYLSMESVRSFLGVTYGRKPRQNDLDGITVFYFLSGPRMGEHHSRGYVLRAGKPKRYL